MRIALVSDTHIPDAIPELPARLLEALRGVDLALHAGDLVSLGALASLQAVAKTVAVHGNADQPEVMRQLPARHLLSLTGRRIGLIHGHQPPEVEQAYLRPEYDYDSPLVEELYEYLVQELPGAEIIVFGHLNVPLVRRWGGRLLVNPGSVAPYRGQASFGLLELGPVREEVEIVSL